jgi:hypothetical protein
MPSRHAHGLLLLHLRVVRLLYFHFFQCRWRHCAEVIAAFPNTMCSGKIILPHQNSRFPRGSSLVSSHYGRPADPLAQFCSCPLWHDQLTHHYPAAMSDNLKVDWGLHHRSQYRKVRISRLTTNVFGDWWFPVKNIVSHTNLFRTFPPRPSKWQQHSIAFKALISMGTYTKHTLLKPRKI